MTIKKCAAEVLGTFLMVFLGTGVAIINEYSGGSVTQLGISIAFGLVVLLCILTLGNISGSHINPAVTITLAVFRHFPYKLVLPYIVSQLVGAIVASCILRLIFPQSISLGATLPSGAAMPSFLLEILLAFLLMLVILQSIKSLSHKKIISALLVSMVVLLEANFAGPICGASMNPARSIAPALISNNLQHIWIYLTAPFIGMLLAGVFFNLIYKIKS